jgi:ubiquinone/menaquinone biosynthesis C-methylase UbiE
MKMSDLEKRFVNRERKALRNVKRVQERLAELDGNSLKDALEVGCGIGSVSAFLANRCAMKVCGTDFDQEEVQLARRLHPENERLRYYVADAADLYFADRSFDLVVSQNVFHHISNWERAVCEFGRVLRDGGYVMWLDLTLPRVINTILSPVLKNYGLYSFDDIRSAFRKGGFSETFEERLFHGPFVHHHAVFRKVT